MSPIQCDQCPNRQNFGHSARDVHREDRRRRPPTSVKMPEVTSSEDGAGTGSAPCRQEAASLSRAHSSTPASRTGGSTWRVTKPPTLGALLSSPSSPMHRVLRASLPVTSSQPRDLDGRLSCSLELCAHRGRTCRAGALVSGSQDWAVGKGSGLPERPLENLPSPKLLPFLSWSSVCFCFGCGA